VFPLNKTFSENNETVPKKGLQFPAINLFAARVLLSTFFLIFLPIYSYFA